MDDEDWICEECGEEMDECGYCGGMVYFCGCQDEHFCEEMEVAQEDYGE